MTSQEILEFLLSLGRENEWIEFKTAGNDFDFDKLGKYFSALSNEANLNNQEHAWLVFGVSNDGKIVGTKYKTNPAGLDALKHDIAKHTSQGLSFVDIHIVITTEGKRVLLFQIPPALKGIPTSWKGHFYGRDGESLVPLNMNEIERIRNQSIFNDWSADECPKATFYDLDTDAVKKAREEYKKKYPRKTSELDQWTDNVYFSIRPRLR